MSIEAPSISSRSGGVRHRPEADIESIRDLLRGYGEMRSILKELIQNAEDAEATRLDLCLVPGYPEQAHPLLRGPGLLAVNDGHFSTEDRDAITQINLGTKGTAERAIGRFGKGLKSIFAWCEAFFIVARTNPELGWPDAFVADLFNPWHNWRHEDWENTFDDQPDVLPTLTQEWVVDLYSDDQPWLAFWFPLRHPDHARDDLGPVKWITESRSILPGEDSRFGDDLQRALKELAPSLVMMRNLKQIAIVDRLCCMNRS